MSERARCNEPGMWTGSACVLRPNHEGDHVHQPKGQPRTAAKTWERKPTLADGVPKKPGIPGQRDQRADPKKDEGDQRAKRDDD